MTHASTSSIRSAASHGPGGDGVSVSHVLQWVALLVLATSPLAYPARPAMAAIINHCVSATGTPVFTDQPCATQDALPASGAGAATPAPTHRGPRFCAHDRPTLKKRVAAAFADDDVNALAALMLWHDYRERDAVHVLQRLSDLVQQPVLGFAQAPGPPDLADDFGFPTDIAPANDAGGTSGADVLRVELANGPPSLAIFPVTHRDECLWLEPPEIAP